MTLRRRLTLWYGLTLVVCVIMAVFPSYDELVIDAPDYSKAEENLGWQRFEAVVRDLLMVAVPVVLIGVVGGWFFTRRALRPLERVVEMAEKLDADTLGERLPDEPRDVEIARLAQVFNAMASRLDHAFDRVREFTLHASHELKTPLAILRSSMETRLSSTAPLSEEDAQRIASQIDEIDRLAQIVDSLGFLVKADAREVPFTQEPVSLHELVTEILADAEVLGAPEQITVRLVQSEEVTVQGDQRRLRQVLVNLTDNAIKHNQPGGFVEYALQHRDAQAVLTVRNSSVEIPPEFHGRMFDRFYRGPGNGLVSDGSGLGLSIVQSILHAHGGQVSFASAAGVTTLTVTLPGSALKLS